MKFCCPFSNGVGCVGQNNLNESNAKKGKGMTNGQKSITWVARVVAVVYVVVVRGLTTLNADAYVNESEGTLLIGYLGLLEVEVEVGVAVKSRDEIVCNVGKLNST